MDFLDFLSHKERDGEELAKRLFPPFFKVDIHEKLSVYPRLQGPRQIVIHVELAMFRLQPYGPENSTPYAHRQSGLDGFHPLHGDFPEHVVRSVFAFPLLTPPYSQACTLAVSPEVSPKHAIMSARYGSKSDTAADPTVRMASEYFQTSV
ncbi:hypothetical protein NQ318_020609 [Aromia moschata]|uniref:Uncharacterized protein n=1 Tax=Aromia moschata TaxID=1265417 RepID=A0AAV8Z0Z5_9CUCU|nr:hypothetical protein NQ318_020609 [Aromia moschata]